MQFSPSRGGVCFSTLFFFFFFSFSAAPVAYGSSQARDWIWAASMTYALSRCTRPGIELLPPQRQGQILNPWCHSGNSYFFTLWFLVWPFDSFEPMRDMSKHGISSGMTNACSLGLLLSFAIFGTKLPHKKAQSSLLNTGGLWPSYSVALVNHRTCPWAIQDHQPPVNPPADYYQVSGPR